MTTIKSYTDIEQSKKLVEILPLESADMYYSEDNTIYAKTLTKYDFTYAKVLYGSYDIRSFNVCGNTPCWSLAALLNILPEPELIQTSEGKWLIRCWTKNRNPWSVGGYDNPIDACYEMILNLNELKLL